MKALGEAELKLTKDVVHSFITSCSHSLKNPLTSIEGLVRVAEQYSEPEIVSKCLSMIQQSTVNMLNMIQKLEEYTTIQQNELSLDIIRPTELVEKIVDEFYPEIDEQSISISTRVKEGSHWMSNEYCNYVILKNLIGNAIHYQDGAKVVKEVTVTIGVGQEHVTLEISDNGIGISAEEQLKIFEPFRRRSSESKGNGLGLFLVKGAVDKLNASLHLQSVEGVGTSIFISVPNLCAA